MSIDNLKTRLSYYGKNAEDRLVKDKRRSLDKALLYSYQGMTISLIDREDPTKFVRDFRCLLNPNKLNPEYDTKILSIPYSEIQLNKPRVGKTSEGIIDTGIKAGDVFYCKETDTYWIIYLQHLEERAYFRADVRLCEKTVEIDKNKYHVYWKGPIEASIAWQLKKGDIWNNLNYSAVMFITKNEQTEAYFHRFAKIEVDNQMWEVAAVNGDSGDGIIKVALTETYNNTIEKENKQYQEELKEAEDAQRAESEPPLAYIDGPNIVHPYDKVTYSIVNMPYDQEAYWQVNNKKANLLSIGDYEITMEITTGRSGEIILSYIFGAEKADRIDKLIRIESL